MSRGFLTRPWLWNPVTDSFVSEDKSVRIDAEIVETEVGKMKVKGVFRTEKTAIIAGGEVTEGKCEAGVLARVIRGKEIIGEAKVESVQKEKMDVSELVSGEIGGLALSTEHKIQLEIGDKLEFFTREEKRKEL